MKSINPLKITLFLALFPLLAPVAHANNAQFPPANAVDMRPFPQQIPSQPTLRAVPKLSMQAPSFRRPVAPYAQQPQLRQRSFNNQYRRPAPNYSQLNRRAMPNARVPRAVPRYPANMRQLPFRGGPPYRNNTNTRNNSFPFSGGNMMPFGNSGSNSFNPFSSTGMPFSNGSNGMMPSMPTNPMNNMFGNNGNSKMPFFPSSNNKKRKKAWGTERNIWPDFYTDFTDEAWDKMMSGPRDLGEMPGGWRFPYISMPDPVTVSDAITNQFPPIAEEAGKMADFSDWGIFD